MTSKTSNKFSPEVRERAVRMVFEHKGEHPSEWAAMSSIAAKIGCTAETLRHWVRQASAMLTPRFATAVSAISRR
jgi:transposase-like protein